MQIMEMFLDFSWHMYFLQDNLCSDIHKNFSQIHRDTSRT
jgi:hypothetical protein